MSTQENQNTTGEETTSERIKRLQARIQDLELQRSDLLLALARERERANALFLAYPPMFPVESAPAAPQPTKLPLRYRLVDAMNDSIKRQFPSIHRAAKEAGFTLLHKLK